MKRKIRKPLFYTGILMLIAFILWTVLVSCVDVKAIGPRESTVGFAALNQYVHNITGINMTLYDITDYLGVVPIGIAAGFAVLGFVQLIKRRTFFKVDRSILLLGVFYIVVIAVYLLFENLVINLLKHVFNRRLPHIA